MRESLTLSILPNGALLLAANNACRAAIRDMQSSGRDEVTILAELTEPYWTNGRFEPFDAGDGNPFVGLTAAPCIAESMDYPDDGSREVVGRLWWFPNYMVTSPADELKRRGRVIFRQAT